MSNRRSAFVLESLEGRTLMAFAGQVVGYYSNHTTANLAKIDLSALTQLNYAFLGINNDGSINAFTGSNLTQLTNTVTAAHAKGVKVNIVADNATATYESIMANSTYVNTFTTQLVNFATTNHLDGIDLDWEDFNASTTQINQFGTMLQTMHAATAANGLTLSAAVLSSQKMVPTNAYSSLDWFNVMDYDLLANSSAPLTEYQKYMTNWSNYGVPKSKLLMGVPFYGRYALGGSNDWANSQTKLYTTIASDYQTQYGTPIPTNLDTVTLNGIPWGFNGVDTMTTKVNWMKSQGFGGTMIWELTEDHWNSSGKYDAQSLLPAIKKAMTLPFATLASGVLTVNQSLAAGAITLGISGTTLTATDGTNTLSFTNASVSSIAFSGTSSADSLTLGAGITQPMTYSSTGGTDSLTINGTYATSKNLGAADSSLGVTVSAGASLTLSGQQTLASLTSNGTTTLAAGAASVLNVGALTLGSSGKLDLNNNALVINYSGTSPATSIQSLLKSGYAGGAWNGYGIASTAAASTTNATLGWAEASSLYTAFPATFAGQSIDATSILIRYTYAGDANLDGTVDVVDLGILSSNWQGTPRTFSQGDFNYDGSVDVVDLGSLSSDWQKTMPGVTLPPTADLLTAVTTKTTIAPVKKALVRV